jgi:hypothetical protein
MISVRPRDWPAAFWAAFSAMSWAGAIRSPPAWERLRVLTSATESAEVIKSSSIILPFPARHQGRRDGRGHRFIGLFTYSESPRPDEPCDLFRFFRFEPNTGFRLKTKPCERAVVPNG